MTYNAIFNFFEQLTEQGSLDTYITALKDIFYLKNELSLTDNNTREDKTAVLLKNKNNK